MVIFRGGYSSECIETAKKPSPMEKSSRMPLHYVIQNDSACYQSNDRQECMNRL